jgi:hypothetical protein
MPASQLKLQEVFPGENFPNSETYAYNSLKLLKINSDNYLTKLFITN